MCTNDCLFFNADLLTHAVVALELKYKAPKAHTMLEIVYVRWGRVAHVVFFFFAVLTNLLVSLSMLQGMSGCLRAVYLHPLDSGSWQLGKSHVWCQIVTRVAAVQAA